MIEKLTGIRHHCRIFSVVESIYDILNEWGWSTTFNPIFLRIWTILHWYNCPQSPYNSYLQFWWTC